METVQVNFLAEYKDLFNEKLRYIIYHGGRYSGKSYHVALSLLLRGRDKKLRILCTREIQNTIRDSVHKLFKDLIDQYSFHDYIVTNESIINKISGTEFIFKGLKRNVNEIKSLEGVDICWIEEAQSITSASLDILTPTIRKEGSQIIMTFNRMTEMDPVYVRYCTHPIPNCMVKEVNYDVLEKVGLLTKVIKEEIEYDKKNNPELYLFKWKGQPLSQLDNAIISRVDIMKAMDQTVSDEGRIEIGVDIARLGNDRSVFWKRKGMKTIDSRIYEKKRLNELCDYIEEFANFDKDTVIKLDDTGLGCLTKNTSILTIDGWKKSSDLKVGDKVYSKNKDGKITIEEVTSSTRREKTKILKCNGYEFSWSHLIPAISDVSGEMKLMSWKEILEHKFIILYANNDTMIFYPKKINSYSDNVYHITISGETHLFFTKCGDNKPIWTHNGGVTDDLMNRGYNSIIPINFGASSSYKDKYNNLISEAWFHMSKIMKDIELPADKDLLMELSTRTWKMDEKGRRCVETKNDYKKRGYRSPDLADACILSYFVQELAEPEIHFL